MMRTNPVHLRTEPVSVVPSVGRLDGPMNGPARRQRVVRLSVAAHANVPPDGGADNEDRSFASAYSFPRDGLWPLVIPLAATYSRHSTTPTR